MSDDCATLRRFCHIRSEADPFAAYIEYIYQVKEVRHAASNSLATLTRHP